VNGHFLDPEQVKTRTLERHKHAAPGDIHRVVAEIVKQLLMGSSALNF